MKARAYVEPKPKLTPRQQQILSYAVFGLSAKEIARMLNISPETVREHMEEAYRRLGANSRSQAISLAYANGLLTEINPPPLGILRPR